MNIAGQEIGSGHPPYLIAELSGNHLGDIRRAKELIVAAKASGASAVKLQCYDADSLTIDCDKPDFILKDGPWSGRTLYELYQEASTPMDWMPELFSHAASIGFPCFASVFDYRGLAMLESVGCHAYKIASMEIVDIPLIEAVAKTGKPVIISTGMAKAHEIGEAISAAGPDTAILHCISGYPTPLEQIDLATLKFFCTMSPWKNIPIGLSDHTLGWEAAVASTAIGGCIIEKHLTLDREDGGPDAEFSMEPAEFSHMVAACNAIWKACQPKSQPSESQEPSRQLRRSLYAVKNIKAGEIFTTDNIRSIRPSYGLPPRELPQIFGETALRPLERGQALSHSDVS